MGSPGGYATRMLVTPPEKGSFPLDHFGECLQFTKAYQQCLRAHNNTNSACHDLAKQYLQCRMDKGLMAREDLNSLGFKKPLVPVTEEERQQSITTRDPTKEYRPGASRMRNVGGHV